MAFFIGHAVIILLVLKIVITGHYKLSQMILAVAGAAAGLVVYITQGNTAPLMLFMFVIGAKGTKDITLGKIFAVCNGLIVGLSMLLCFAGIVEDRTFHAVDRGLRHSMEMTYVTIWAVYVFFITAAIIYIRYGKLHRFDWLILIGIAFIVDYYSKTRVEEASLLFLAVLMIPLVLDRIHGIIIPQMIDSYLCPFYIFLFARYTLQRTADRGEFPFVKQRIKARI